MLSGDPRRSVVEDIQELRRRERRDALGHYVVEGARFVHEALTTRTPILRAAVAPELCAAPAREAARRLARAVEVEEVSAAAFRAFSRADEPSGIAAVVALRRSTLPRPARGATPLWLAFGGLRTPGNVGTTLRTALAAGAAGALFLDARVDPWDPACVRASMGAVLRLPLVRATPQHLAAWARRVGAVVVGTSAHAARTPDALPRRRPTVVLVGCERRGLSRAERRICDVAVRIPMAAGVPSLNVAVAAGVLLFAARDALADSRCARTRQPR